MEDKENSQWKVTLRCKEDAPQIEKDWAYSVSEAVPPAEHLAESLARASFEGPNPSLVYAFLYMISDLGYTHDELLSCDLDDVRTIAKAVAKSVGFVSKKEENGGGSNDGEREAK